MRYFILFLILLIAENFSAQTSNAVFKGDTPFKIYINKIVQHDAYVTSININELLAEQRYTIKVEYENDTVIVTNNIYLFDANWTYNYTVSKKSILLKKVVPTLALHGRDSSLTITYQANKNLPIDTLVTDTITKKDTVYVPPFETYYHMENYNGKIGCPWPLKDEVIAKLKGAIKSKSLEDSKLEIAKEKIQDIDSICFTMDQTIEILSLIEFEETKLNLAKFMAPYLFDIDNVGKLEAVFDFENSIEELKKLLNQ